MPDLDHTDQPHVPEHLLISLPFPHKCSHLDAKLLGPPINRRHRKLRLKSLDRMKYLMSSFSEKEEADVGHWKRPEGLCPGEAEGREIVLRVT